MQLRTEETEFYIEHNYLKVEIINTAEEVSEIQGS